ncbi:essential MCU regulator, mitochondrial-like [Scaptodrosophila lebanonensis]|uniref:Essential MCU regulator, mitochondrial n=1 Tax=Drosophila lebanonensis TaxID=7225 RepID=A0A6J2TXD4_DROLE|nr:essential MCU regulator, mitochondrial-like [Scaptodrosophila lebanonensis]
MIKYITKYINLYRNRTYQLPRHLKGSYKRIGPLKKKPSRDENSTLGLFVTVVPGMILGGYLAKALAYLLELSEIFQPEDPDDFDDDDN